MAGSSSSGTLNDQGNPTEEYQTHSIREAADKFLPCLNTVETVLTQYPVPPMLLFLRDRGCLSLNQKTGAAPTPAPPAITVPGAHSTPGNSDTVTEGNLDLKPSSHHSFSIRIISQSAEMTEILCGETVLQRCDKYGV